MQLFCVRNEKGGRARRRMRMGFRREELDVYKTFLIAVTPKVQLGKEIVSLSVKNT